MLTNLRILGLLVACLMALIPSNIAAQDKRIPAPELNGGDGWLNAERPFKLSEHRGKVALVVFWANESHSINILPDIKRFEDKYANQLIVIFVLDSDIHYNYSPIDADTFRSIVQRQAIKYPVVNDSQKSLYDSYSVDAWPTRFVIDPSGKIVGKLTGEGGYDAIDTAIAQTVNEFRQQGKLNEQPFQYTQGLEVRTNRPSKATVTNRNIPPCDKQGPFHDTTLTVVVTVKPAENYKWTMEDAPSFFAQALIDYLNEHATKNLTFKEANGVNPNLYIHVTMRQDNEGTQQNQAWVEVTGLGKQGILFKASSGESPFINMRDAFNRMGDGMLKWFENGWYTNAPCVRADGSVLSP